VATWYVGCRRPTPITDTGQPRSSAGQLGGAGPQPRHARIHHEHRKVRVQAISGPRPGGDTAHRPCRPPLPERPPRQGGPRARTAAVPLAPSISLAGRASLRTSSCTTASWLPESLLTTWTADVQGATHHGNLQEACHHPLTYYLKAGSLPINRIQGLRRHPYKGGRIASSPKHKKSSARVRSRCVSSSTASAARTKRGVKLTQKGKKRAQSSSWASREPMFDQWTCSTSVPELLFPPPCPAPPVCGE